MSPLVINNSDKEISEDFIVQWLNSLHQEFKDLNVDNLAGLEQEITLVFMNEAEARSLNLEFRGKDYPTDILSFDSIEEGSLGELVICSQVIARQAIEHKLSFEEELGYMITHGVLHLLGYDHETNEEEAREMFRIQDEAFARLLQKNPAKT